VNETSARTRYELFVGRHVSAATLATFPVALVPTAVPRNSVHRLRVGADSDIAEIVRRLTERGVEILEIRRCPQRPRWRPQQRRAVPAEETAGADVVVLVPRAGAGDVEIPATGTGDEPVAPISPIRSQDGFGPRIRRPRHRVPRA
jgi:hypothetical protein